MERSARTEITVQHGDSPPYSAAERARLEFYDLRGFTEVCRTDYGEVSIEHAIALQRLGVMLIDQRSLQEGLSTLRDALKRFEDLKGSESAEVADAAAEIARGHSFAGDPREALRELDRALRIRRKLGDAEGRHMIHLLMATGIVRRSQGDMLPAIAAFEQAIPMAERVFGRDHHETAVILNQAGLTFGYAMQLERSRELLERAIAAFTASDGEDDADTAAAVNNLGLTLDHMGRWTKRGGTPACARDQAQGPRPQRTTRSRSATTTSAALSRKKGRFADALNFAQKELEIYETAYGRDHADKCVRYRGRRYRVEELGRFDEAGASLEEALEIQE